MCLSRAGHPVRSFRLAESAVEIGSHPSCDIAIHEARVPSRALLVHPSGGTVYLYDLVERPGFPVSINIEGNHIVTSRGVEYLHPPNERILLIH